MDFQLTHQLIAQNSLVGVKIAVTTLVILALALLSLYNWRIKKAEEAFRESQRRLSSLIDSLPGIVYSCANDSNWSMRYLSEGCFNLTGYKSRELVGNKADSYNSITHPEDVPKLINTINKAIAQKQPYMVEYRIYTKSGEEKWLWEKGSGVFDDQGKVLGLEGFITDITELKQTQELLRTQQEFLHQVIDTNPNCTFIKNKEGKYILANQATANRYGTTTADIIGKTDADFNINQKEVERFLGEDKEVIETLQEKFISEETVTDFTGRIRWFQTIKKPLMSPDGSDCQILGVATDISDRKLVESALRQSEAKNRALLNAIPDLILRISKDGTYLDYKRAKDFGILVPDSELLGKTEYEVLPPALAQQRMHYIKRALETGETQIFEYQLPLDGKTQHEEARIVVSGEDEVLVIIRDNTERKQAEAALRESEERFRCLSDCSPVGIFLTDVEGQFTYTNPRCQEICGFTFKDLGKGWLHSVHPDERESVLADWSAYAYTKEKYLQECRFQPQEGIVRWVYVRTAPMLSDQGKLLGHVGTIEDITERKQAELALQTARDELEIRVEERTAELSNTNQQLQNEIAERKKAEAEVNKLNQDLQRRAIELEAANKELEAFSYSVSHDLRAPLRAINGFSRILLNEYATQFTPEAERYLQMVRDNAQQMGCLIDDLLTFSRLSRSPLKKHLVAPIEIVRQVLEDLEHQQRQIEISISELPVCQADAALLKQVWVNLLSNALKFTRLSQAARIEIGYQQTDGELIYFVKDNGVGFDMQYAHKLFGVFQRLHRAEEYDGTGVGLAIVQRVVHRHGGRVWALAEVNKGATFYFTLGGDSHDSDSGRHFVSRRQPQRCRIDAPFLEKQ